jgi:hypothetical protein
MEQVWFSRMRWRLRGAWMWPTFLAATLLDAVLLGALPIAGEDGPDFFPALILAGVFNLIAVAVAAPLLGLLVRRRNGSLPRMVATDYAGTALVLAVTAGLLIAGLIHRPEVQEAKRTRAAALAAAQRYVVMRAPQPYRANGALTDTKQLDANLFRTCTPGDRADRALCLFVDTAQSPPGVTLDRSRAPNGVLGAPAPR